MLRTAHRILHAVILAAGAFVVPAAAQEAKQRVAIFDFETVGFKSDVGKSITEIFRVAMINTGKYRVVERETLDKVLREQNLQVGSAIIDENSAVKIGKILGAEYIIIGNVVKLGETYTINTRMVDVQTAESVSAKSVRYSTEQGLMDKIDGLAAAMTGTQPKTSSVMLDEVPAQTPPAAPAAAVTQPRTQTTQTAPSNRRAEIRRRPGAGRLVLGLLLMVGGTIAAVDGFSNNVQPGIDISSWNWDYLSDGTAYDTYAWGTIKNTGNCDVTITQIEVRYLNASQSLLTSDTRSLNMAIPVDQTRNWSLDSYYVDTYSQPSYATINVRYTHPEYLAKSEIQGYIGIGCGVLGGVLVLSHIAQSRAMAALNEKGISFALAPAGDTWYFTTAYRFRGITFTRG
jgi:curli biogenesis system outer membrane secretion channel CsgG